ncbi:LysR family transcriptional regulator, partial [bacterium 210702-DFI.5.13]|nr:LysR family transcriptional regulator [bacterium 210702-DFI.5.13]
QIMLMPFQEILVGGTTFTALSSQELSLREVKNYPLISLGRETMTYKFYNSVFLSHGLDLSPDTEAATADQILPLVKCELGLAFLPQPMA